MGCGKGEPTAGVEAKGGVGLGVELGGGAEPNRGVEAGAGLDAQGLGDSTDGVEADFAGGRVADFPGPLDGRDF